ncbi:hypothetical protein GIB67_042474 [Kingdonia uniflora]|uniref:Uncharacterized protein n=1 Tax=Kingdonia uniflora TaxID=39325 RepID=A0A7J7M0X0_9MAGN|nr:hypothetical protein GIB67_042474 [Kingdonia uniflora]
MQGFRKVDPDRWEFANEGFLKGQKHLLKTINRRKSSAVQSHQPQPQTQTTSVGACVEVGKFGLEEEIERLKRDKNVLMQELVRLRQQQQSTDNQLLTLGQRLQGMEQRQQQMMSFLAKAMQSPGFLAQLVQQQSDSNNRRIVGVSKKRRLPKHEDKLEDGQIIKYQPLMNEAAKAMLMQILKIDTPDNNFLINNGLEISGTPSSGLTLSEVSPSFEGFPAILPSSEAISEIQSSSSGVITTDMASTSMCDENIGHMDPADLLQFDTVLPEFPQIEGMLSEQGGTENGNGGQYMDSMSLEIDEALSLQTDEFLADPETNIYDDTQLPGINDIFWEQFLGHNQLAGDTDEMYLSTPENASKEEAVQPGQENVWNKGQNMEVAQPGQENGWNKGQNMEHLTEQMGLLTSETKGR